MQHKATPQFWKRLEALPDSIQRLAHKNYALLKSNPGHPSLSFKKVGKYWSARVGRNYRAIAVKDDDDFIWVWIGSHDQYDQMLS